MTSETLSGIKAMRTNDLISGTELGTNVLNLPVKNALSALRLPGEDAAPLSQINLIAVEPSPGSAVILDFRPEIPPGLEALKGSDRYSVHFQRVGGTDLNPATINDLYSKGKGVELGSIVAVVTHEGVQTVNGFQSGDNISAEQIGMSIDGRVAYIPLMASVPYQKENGDQGLLVVTRFPVGDVDVDPRGSLQMPKGTVDPDSHIIKRKSTSAPMEGETNTSRNLRRTGTILDVVRNSGTKNNLENLTAEQATEVQKSMMDQWMIGKYKAIFDTILDPENRTGRETIMKIFENQIEEMPSENTLANKMALEIARSVCGLEDQFEVMDKANGGFVRDSATQQILMADSYLLQLEQHRQALESQWQRHKHIPSYVEAAGYFLVLENWAKKKRW